MRISVVVPSYNGLSTLPRLLDGLKTQTHLADEVIVVLDGSTDGSYEFLKKSLEMETLHVVNLRTNKGRSIARNEGLKLVSSELVVFFDDDVQLKSDTIEKHYQFHSKVEKPVFLSGPAIESADCDTELCKWRRYLIDKWSDTTAPEVHEVAINKIVFTAANFSSPVNLLRTLGGFDNSLNDCEDFDLAVKALSMKYSIIHDAGNSVNHTGYKTIRKYIVRQREYQSQLREIARKKSKSQFLKYYSQRIHIKKPLNSFIYWFFPSSLVHFADQGNFKFLPISLRFKVYDYLVSAFAVYYPKRPL